MIALAPPQRSPLIKVTKQTKYISLNDAKSSMNERLSAAAGGLHTNLASSVLPRCAFKIDLMDVEQYNDKPIQATDSSSIDSNVRG